MSSVNVHIRYSNENVVLPKVTNLTTEGNLVYRDEGGDASAHVKTIGKFTLLTVGSPLIALARLVRSVAFACKGEFGRAGREFIGGLAQPLVASAALVGTLASAAVYGITKGEIAFYVKMRRMYAHVEAWTNGINLSDRQLASFSQRVSNPTDALGTSSGTHKNVWTTAPCMQPVLENGYSDEGGLRDVSRMRRIFPFLKINGVHKEGNKVVLESEYTDEDVHYTACNGACEHSQKSATCCCCFRIEAVYDRFLCCEVSKGSCTSIDNPNGSCGIVHCSACGLFDCCCCYVTAEDQATQVNAGCCAGEQTGCLVTYALV